MLWFSEALYTSLAKLVGLSLFQLFNSSELISILDTLEWPKEDISEEWAGLFNDFAGMSV